MCYMFLLSLCYLSIFKQKNNLEWRTCQFSLYYNNIIKQKTRSKLILNIILTAAIVYRFYLCKRFSIAGMSDFVSPRYSICIWVLCVSYRADLFFRTYQTMPTSLALVIDTNYCLLARTLTCRIAKFSMTFTFNECLTTLFIDLLFVYFLSCIMKYEYLMYGEIVLNTAIINIFSLYCLSDYFRVVNFVDLIFYVFMDGFKRQ